MLPRRTINHQEAGAFLLSCAMRGLTEAQALSELDASAWPQRREDLAFGRRRHAPTIRRLVRRAIALQKGRDIVVTDVQKRQEAERAAWNALPPDDRERLTEATHVAVLAPNKKSAARFIARAAAAAHGLVWTSQSMLALCLLIFGEDLLAYRKRHVAS